MEIRMGLARFFLAFPNARMSDTEGMAETDMDPLIYFLLLPKGRRCLIQEQ